MATLFNTKISNTYQGLLKTVDNAAISATLRELSDGSGNQTGLYLNTAGDFKVTSVLEWGSLKDTGTGVTITRYVTSTDGLENFDNNTSLPTSAAVKLYVDTKFATSDTLQEVLSFGNTTSGNDIVVSANDDITFTDSSKALFGNSQDLEINHNGTDSFVTDLGTGDLRLRSDNSIKIQASTGGNNLATFTKGAGVDLYFNNAKKLETTNIGISVTGIISNLTNPISAQDAATKSYVDALDAGSDLDITDGTNTGAVNLNTQTLSILGTTNEIEAVVSGQGVTIGLPSSISTDLVGNVTGNVTGNVAGDLTGNVTSTSVLANGVTATTQASTDSSTKVATTAYVKGLDNASDLDFSGDSGTGDVNLNAQTFAITGTANQIESSASNQGLSLQFPSAGVTLPNGSVATTQSADDNSTKVATTSYVDTSAALYLPLVGGTMSGNTIHNDSIKSIYGTGSDAQVYHDGSNFYANNSTGQLNIDQSAVTESIVFKTSDANALDTTALIINRGGDLITGRDVTIAGDLTVNGTTTTVNSQTLSVDDPLISLAINNAANSLDIGYYGKYNDGTTRYLGLFNDSSDSNKFKLFKGTTVEPTTTVNIGAAGYVAADLQVAGLEATNFVSTDITIADYIYHAGDTNTYFGFNGLDNFKLTAGGNDNFAVNASTVYLKHTGNTKLITKSTGVAVTGYLSVTSGVDVIGGNIDLVDNSKIRLGTSQDLQIYHDGSNSYIKDVGTGNLNILASTSINLLNGDSSDYMARFNDNGSNQFFYDGSKKLETTSTGVSVTGGGTFTGSIDTTAVNIKVGSATHGTITSSSSSLTLNARNTGNMLFQSGGTEKMRITSAGNVGIGTDSPSAKLEVDGNVKIGDATTGATFAKSGDVFLITGIDTASNAFNSIHLKADSLDTGLVIQKDTNNVGIGTTSPDEKLHVSGGKILVDVTSSIGTELILQNLAVDQFAADKNYHEINFITSSTSSETTGGYVRIKAGQEVSGNDNKSYLGFWTAPDDGTVTEKMRIDSSGNVGIGTTSPDTNLEVSSATGGVLRLTSTDTTVQTGESIGKIEFKSNDASTGGDNVMGFVSCVARNVGTRYALSFGTGDAAAAEERMRIDNLGNVGIGTDSPDSKLTSNGRIEAISLGTDHFRARYNSTYYTDYSTNGVRFNGDNQTYSLIQNGTTRLIVDDGGNVGIGTTSPEMLLDVGLQGSAGAGDFKKVMVNVNGGYSTDATFQYKVLGYTGTTRNATDIFTQTTGEAVKNFYTGMVGAQYFNNNRWSIIQGGVERLTVEGYGSNAGNVGIGTDSPQTKLHLYDNTATVGLSIQADNASSSDVNFGDEDDINIGRIKYEHSNDSMQFQTNNAERMRITSAGYLRLNNQDAGNYLFKIAYSGSSQEAIGLQTTYNGGGNMLRFLNYLGAAVGGVYSSNTATSYNTSSDYRLKEDLQDFAGLDMVSKIPVYDFKWKSDESRSYGVMAHELQEVLPDAVSGEKDAEEMQGVDYSKIVPLLIKSIQELTAKVERLEAK